jgi:phosphatidylserine/phosphatidylglycerophosphate/cardiolipin synthase-like enzyme
LSFIAVSALLQACGELTTPTTPTPSGHGGSDAGWYQLYFTSPVYPDNDPKKRTPSLDAKLSDFIHTATKSVDIAIYQLDLPNVTQALLDAKKRNATVRVVTDVNIYADAKENPSFKELEKADIKVVAGNQNAIMHNKFVVVDGARVWTGSWNFTANDTWRYNNHGLAITAPELARNYTATFEKMWKDNQFGRQRKAGGTTAQLIIGGVKVENYFSPEDKVASKIITRLRQAKTKIDFMAYSFTDDALGDALLERAKAGVKIRGVFENTGSQTQFSEFGRLQKANLEVRTDGNPYLMHHKVFIVDGRIVVFGSFNFSKNADEENDENLLIIDDEPLATAFTTEFERVVAQAQRPPK